MQRQKLVQNSQYKGGASRAKISIGRVVFSLSAIAVFTKIFGFGEKVVIAHFFGTTDMADVYFASMGIVLSIVLLVRELIYPSLLPVFVESLSGPDSASGNLFRKVFLSSFGFLTITAIIIAVFSRFFTTILVPGFSESERQMTSNLLRLMTPGMFLLGLTMVSYTALNARRRFLTAALPEAALKLFIVIGLMALLPILGIYTLAVILGLGALGSLLVQLYFIPEHGFLFRQQGDRSDYGHFGKMLLLMGPLVVGVMFSHISGLVDNLLASTLPSGRLSYLGYSKKLVDAVLLIGPVALVTVVYSQLSHFASAKDYKKFTALFIKAFRLLLYFSVPVGCLLIGLRYPLLRCLFQRGQFNSQSTFGTSQALLVYGFGMVTFSVESLLVHSFFALSDTKTPVKLGILCVFLDVALAILLLKPFGYLGIAGALVISKTIKVILLAAGLNKKLKGLFDLSMLFFSAKLAISSIAAYTALKLLLNVDNPVSLAGLALFDLLLPAAGTLLVFVLCSHLLRISELKSIIALLIYRKAAVSYLYGDER
jgi:putative peptidoglycan lipid II flippase